MHPGAKLAISLTVSIVVFAAALSSLGDLGLPRGSKPSPFELAKSAEGLRNGMSRLRVHWMLGDPTKRETMDQPTKIVEGLPTFSAYEIYQSGPCVVFVYYDEDWKLVWSRVGYLDERQ